MISIIICIIGMCAILLAATGMVEIYLSKAYTKKVKIQLYLVLFIILSVGEIMVAVGYYTYVQV